jgi:gamma-glutamylcyclotransferase
MMKSELVFVYGSNMDPAQMRERCPESDLSWFIAEARGWKLCFPRTSPKRKGGVGSIVREPGQSVWGVVFAVTDRDLVRLDSYEGVPKGAYTREPIEVFDQQDRKVQVLTYIAVPQQGGPFTPHKDYIDLYVRGAKYFGLPEAHVRTLEVIRKGAKKD